MSDKADGRFRAIFEHSHDAILLADDDGRIIDANPAAEALLGYSSDEFSDLHTWDFISGMSEAEGRTAWTQFLAEGQEEGQYPLQRKDGQIVHTEYRAVAHIQAGTHLSVIRDVTEWKRSEERLKESNRDLDAFASYLAHEVRSPLTTVSMVLGWLQRRYAGVVQNEDLEYMRRAERAVQGVKHLTADLLAYARLDHGATLEREEVDSSDVVREALTLLEGEIEEHGAKVTTGDLPTVYASQALLRHVVRNLIANGITHNESEVARIHVDADEEAGAWAFRVEDNGVGIPEEKPAELFDLFARGKAGKAKGVGVGLALTKRIVERHGGRIWIQSEPGRGSTFFFTLPKRPDRT